MDIVKTGSFTCHAPYPDITFINSYNILYSFYYYMTSLLHSKFRDYLYIKIRIWYIMLTKKYIKAWLLI